MTIRVYRSTDAGAPALSGAVGGLIPVLDACLVDGYGAVASAGWTKEFSGANKAVYRMPEGATHRGYFRVDDSATNRAGIIGYHAMSSVDVGTGEFNPTGYLFRATNTGTRAWMIVTDGLTVYYFVASASRSGWVGHVFGEFVSLRTGDASPMFIQAHAGATYDFLYASITLALGSRYYSDGCKLSSDYGGGGQVSFFPLSSASDSFADGTRHKGFTGRLYPNPITLGFTAVPVYIAEMCVGDRVAMRGMYPGLYAMMENTATMADGSTFTDVSGAPGRTLQSVYMAESDYPFNMLIDITGPWR